MTQIEFYCPHGSKTTREEQLRAALPRFAVLPASSRITVLALSSRVDARSLLTLGVEVPGVDARQVAQPYCFTNKVKTLGILDLSMT